SSVSSSAGECKPVECMDPPPHCTYLNAKRDANGCPKTCGSMRCDQASSSEGQSATSESEGSSAAQDAGGGGSSSQGEQSTASSSQANLCGNGKIDWVVNHWEECDDGAKNGTPGDLCTTSCTVVTCGNGIVQQVLQGREEECDDGTKNGTPGDPCSASCKLITNDTDGSIVQVVRHGDVPVPTDAYIDFQKISPDYKQLTVSDKIFGYDRSIDAPVVKTVKVDPAAGYAYYAMEAGYLKSPIFVALKLSDLSFRILPLPGNGAPWVSAVNPANGNVYLAYSEYEPAIRTMANPQTPGTIVEIDTSQLKIVA